MQYINESSRGFFSDYRNCIVKLKTSDISNVEHKVLLPYERYTIECLYKFGIAMSLQLFCCVTSKAYFSKVSMKRFKESVRRLAKEGYLCSFEIGDNTKRVYLLDEKGIDYCKRHFSGLEARAVNFLKVTKECDGNILPEIFYEQLVINQFISSSVSTAKVVSQANMLDLGRIELPETINISYLPAFVRIALPRGSTVLPEGNRFGIQAVRTITVFPLTLVDGTIEEQCIFLGKQLYAVWEYVQQLGIRNYLVVVIVGNHYQAELLHEKLNCLNDKRAVGHFYLLEDDMFYAPYSNLFSVSGGKINQYSLFG